MKARKKLKKYFQKRNSNIIDLLKKPGEKFSVSDFHDLRVEIKKIKALLKFIDFSADNFKVKALLKPYQNIFKKAGKVRDFQLEESELKKMRNRKSFRNYLQDLDAWKDERKSDFFNTIDKDLKKLLKKSPKKIDPSMGEIDKSSVADYLEEKEREIAKLIGKKELEDEKLHQLRKDLKTYGYIRKIFDKNLPDKKLNRSENFQDLLGKWHDKQIINKHLDKVIRSHQVKPVESKQLIRIRAKNLEDRKLLRKKINQMIHSGNGRWKHDI